MNNNEAKLVDAAGLLEALFPENSRPSVRWIRLLQKRRQIPYVKLGHLVRFDPTEVRSAIASQHTIRPRGRRVVSHSDPVVVC